MNLQQIIDEVCASDGSLDRGVVALAVSGLRKGKFCKFGPNLGVVKIDRTEFETYDPEKKEQLDKAQVQTQEELRVVALNAGYKVDKEWTWDLERTQVSGAVKNTARNLCIIFDNDEELSCVYRDEILQCDIVTKDSKTIGWVEGGQVLDVHLTAIGVYLSDNYGLEIANSDINNYLSMVASRNKRNPVKEKLESLKWDGTPRLDKLLIEVADVEDSAFARAATARTFIGAVARAFQPGAKVDTVLVLEGEQGARKSSLFALLGSVAGTRYCLAERPDPTSKDAMQQVSCHWFVIIDEFETFTQGDVAALKQFVTKTSDTFRAPYDRRAQRHERRCVFVATINRTENDYLNDPTGNRRFWPLEAHGEEFDLEPVRRDLEQLWAEAVHRYKAGEPWFISKGEDGLWNAATEAQDDRNVKDIWHPIVEKWCTKQETYFTALDVLRKCFGYSDTQMDHKSKHRIGRILTMLGWKRVQVREDNGSHRWVYDPERKQGVGKTPDDIEYS